MMGFTKLISKLVSAERSPAFATVNHERCCTAAGRRKLAYICQRMYACCEMHVSHAYHMHEPGTDARIWTCDVWWATHIGVAHIRNMVWCI